MSRDQIAVWRLVGAYWDLDPHIWACVWILNKLELRNSSCILHPLVHPAQEPSQKFTWPKIWQRKLQTVEQLRMCVKPEQGDSDLSSVTWVCPGVSSRIGNQQLLSLSPRLSPATLFFIDGFVCIHHISQLKHELQTYSFCCIQCLSTVCTVTRGQHTSRVKPNPLVQDSALCVCVGVCVCSQ